MCRLFGLHAGRDRVSATFWLLDAPDSLAAQSHRNPDGAGLGAFDADASPVVDKQPIAAWDDTEFAAAARELTSTTFVAHVRHASTGAHTVANTHPFAQDGRLFAHNGVLEGLAQLDARLAELGASALVHGETDSERMFALITAETARHDGDVGAGIAAALGWVSAEVPVYSVNLLIATPTDLWALRYPATNELWVLDKAGAGAGALDLRTDRIHAQSDDPAARRGVVLASEPMNADPRWRALESGELLHVRSDLVVQSRVLFPDPPAHPLTLDDLQPAAATSQQPTP